LHFFHIKVRIKANNNAVGGNVNQFDLGQDTMMMSMLLEVFVKAFLLLILLYIVAREEADFDFRKLTMVTAAIVLGAVILDAALTRFIGLLTLIPILALIVFMVMKFCWVRFWRSLLVGIPFLILSIMISTSVATFRQKADMAMSRGLQGPVSEKDMQEALSFLRQQNDGAPFPMPSKMEAPKTDPTLDQVLMDQVFKRIFAGIKSINPAGAKTAPAVNQNQEIKGAAAGAGPKAPPAVASPAVPEEEAPKTLARVEDWQGAGKKINVKGTLLGKDGVRVAIVNNQMVREGEFVRVEHNNIIYRWRAGTIREKGVSWEPVEAVKK